jgi:hypothetical protein
MDEFETKKLHALLESCLEAVRREAVRRLEEKSLPTSVSVERLIVVDHADGTGWRGEPETINVSALQVPNILAAIRDESVPFRMIGFREQLLPLAELLDKTTELGGVQASGFVPQATGPDAIIGRYLSGLALQYIAGLDDVCHGNKEALQRGASDLDLLCNPRTVRRTYQLALAGVKVEKPLQPYRNVSLRSLTPTERGAVLETQQAGLGLAFYTPDFIVPRQMTWFAPVTLLEVTTSRQRTQINDRSELMNRVALAFFLSGFELSSLGLLPSFDEPRWASMGVSHTPYPIAEKNGVTNKTISRENFESVVDLAHKMPDFGGTETSGRKIVLSRVLRGCASADSGFLDFAIALEAALLGGSNTELAYKFSLYGALFLQKEHDTRETFAKLKNVYAVRSKLVHGSRVKPESLRAAEQDASELARLVTKKAITDGWPSTKELDALALTVSPSEERR